ncbi:MAG: sodium-dependent transporter [Methanophagales archaeon ANME-1-THS]|nr:MAG: sodium-dependent transporter [Methanophagales archaeon ANME-1-THS]
MPRERWSSRIGFLLAGIGSAVGLGNIWRFPYIVGQNGGGAFLIPYLISILLLGIPLMILEFAVGRHFRGSTVSSLKRIRNELKWIGVIVTIVSTVILSYYLVITGWTLAFFIFMLSGTELVFGEFIQTYFSPLFFVIVVFMTSFIVAKGIRRGIERTSTIMVPALMGLLAVMVVYALTLPKAVDGISFYLTPDFSRLLDYSVWIAALGQAFFSLSVGSGILLTYGSYLDERVSLESNSGIIALSDSLISFISGLVVFSIVFSFNFEPAAGPSLAFATLPLIFMKVPYGFLLADVFYLLLFFAALTSAISMLEVGVAVLVDETSMSRLKAASLLSVIILVLGFPAALSYSRIGLQLLNTPVLDLMDRLFGSLAIIFTALLISVSSTWFCPKRTIVNQINKNTKCNLGAIIFFLLKYIIPLALFFVLVSSIIGYA